MVYMVGTTTSAEASAFVAFVGCCMAFLVVFYLYVTKRFCFPAIAAGCCDDPGDKTSTLDNKEKVQRDLAASFGYDHKDEGYYDAQDDRSTGDHLEDSSTADSDAEILQRLQRSASTHFTERKRKASLGRATSSGGRGSGHSGHSRKSVVTLRDTNCDHLVASESSDRLLEGSEVSYGRGGGGTPASGALTASPTASTISTVIETERTPSGADGDIRERRMSSKNSSRTASGAGRAGPSTAAASSSKDPMSMAEKGRIGKLNSSRSGSSESADTEEEHVPFLLRQRSTEKSSSCPGDSRPSTANSDHPPQTILKARPPLLGQSNSGFQRSTDSEATSEASGTRCLSRQMTTSSLVKGPASSSSSNVQLKVGTLEIAHSYDPPTKRLQVTVIEARDIPSRDRGGTGSVCVRLVVLPAKKLKAKTKARPAGDAGRPQFAETFTFAKVPPEEVLGMGIRFRLYGCERMRREHLIGEGVVAFSCSRPLQTETRIRIVLEPRSNLARTDSRSDVSSLARSDSTGSTQSMQNAVASPELLLGLAYNGTTGRLQATAIKGSQFKSATMTRAPDTHVKLTLVSSSGVEIASSKTSVRRGQPNPLFKETFVFQVALFQLPDVTLMVSVYAKRSMKRKKEMLGWFSLGLNSSGEEELCHWNDMRDSKGEQICRWHVLLES